MAMVLAGCSDDDSYEAAEALKSDCQQVHFSADNTSKTLLFGSLLVSQTSGYSGYDSSTKTGWMYVYYMQTSTGKEDYWGSLNFTIK